MQWQISVNIREEKKLTLLAYVVRQDDQAITRLLASLRLADEAHLQSRLKKEKFSGRAGQVFVIINKNQIILLLGLGQFKKITSEHWRQATGSLVSYLRNYQTDSIGLVLNNWLQGSSDVQLLGQSLAEGLSLAQYSFDRYKKTDKNKIKVAVKTVWLQMLSGHKKRFEQGWKKGELLAQATNLARDLVNEPAEVMTPTFLAEEARRIAKANRRIVVKILEEDKVKKMGMGGFWAVDKGSREPLKFIHLTYRPRGRAKDRVALVGKGITFDSGGLNLKPEMGMADMKIDMAGAAAVLGVFSALSQLDCKLEVQGFIAACENMPSGSSIRPGDVVRTISGRTIEIANTDAEGRVTLADAFGYAQRQGLKTIVDLATLTGAVMIALGENYTGLFANDDKLARALEVSAELAGEKMWRLPLPEEYKKLNDSKIADIRNIPSTRYGGAITAALFLQEFIDKGVDWAHLDIAGPAYADKPLNNYTPLGGVGYGVRTILNWLGK